MPFGVKPGPAGKDFDFDKVYDLVIVPVTKRLKLQSIRADKILKPGGIHQDMLRRVAESDVSIVDITSGNPNVFYELGVRHALRRAVTVILKQKDANIPFNIGGQRVIDYDMSYEGVVKAREDLEAFIEAGLASKDGDSLVYEMLPELQVSLAPKS
jgi:hypothetical protein